ncbi:MAG: response regulator [Nitrospirales bacterium]
MAKALNIWLIDDDDTFILLFETALETVLSGTVPYTFNGFEDSDKAMKILRGQLQEIDNPPNPDLIFLDHRMPQKDGWEILQELKTDKSTQCIPVCMLSSSANPKELRQCYSLGANACMTKPMSFKELGPKLQLTCQFFSDVFELPE